MADRPIETGGTPPVSKPQPSPLLRAFVAIAVRLAREEAAAEAAARTATEATPQKPGRAA